MRASAQARFTAVGRAAASRRSAVASAASEASARIARATP